MASKRTLNAKNLEALGAPRLAELLIEISTGDAAAKRRLRLELAGAVSPVEVAREIRKRLTTIARARGFIDWQKRKAFVADPETQRRAIIGQVAKTDPAEALDLLWRFMALANPVFERCDDGGGTVIGVFHAACRDLGRVAATAKTDPKPLAEQALRALTENDYGQHDELIEALTPALGSAGLDHLKQLFIELSKEPPPKPRGEDRKIIASGSGGPVYADDYAERRHDSTVRMALREIADAQGDVDAFIAQQSEKARTVPEVAAEIAQRLLAALPFPAEAVYLPGHSRNLYQGASIKTHRDCLGGPPGGWFPDRQTPAAPWWPVWRPPWPARRRRRFEGPHRLSRGSSRVAAGL